MDWTNQIPDKSGYYWIKTNGLVEDKEQIIQIIIKSIEDWPEEECFEIWLFGIDWPVHKKWAAKYVTEWYGPILNPD